MRGGRFILLGHCPSSRGTGQWGARTREGGGGGGRFILLGHCLSSRGTGQWGARGGGGRGTIYSFRPLPFIKGYRSVGSERGGGEGDDLFF